MKIIRSMPDRNRDTGIYLKSGAFSYKVECEWAKWPAGVKGSDVLGVACDKDDKLYAATSHKEHPICVFNAQGDFVRSFGKEHFDRAHSISFTSRGTMLCADSGTKLHVVQELDLDGRLVRTFGNLGKPSDTGYDVNAYDKELATQPSKDVSDLRRRQLELFFSQIDSIERAAGPFNRPCHMAEASTGEMFAADGYGNAAVHKFAADGAYLETWGGPGTSVGQYRLPHWINIDRFDRVWVCDRENSRAYAYTTSGEIIAMLDGEFCRVTSCWSDHGHIYFGELGGGFFIVDLNTLEVVAQFGYPYLNLFACHGIGGDSKGNLYISSISQNRPVGNLFKLTRI
jgi:hypothetical protein